MLASKPAQGLPPQEGTLRHATWRRCPLQENQCRSGVRVLFERPCRGVKILTNELYNEALGRLYAHIEHPIALKKGQKITVQSLNQYGEARAIAL